MAIHLQEYCMRIFKESQHKFIYLENFSLNKHGYGIPSIDRCIRGCWRYCSGYCKTEKTLILSCTVKGTTFNLSKNHQFFKTGGFSIYFLAYFIQIYIEFISHSMLFVLHPYMNTYDSFCIPFRYWEGATPNRFLNTLFK